MMKKISNFLRKLSLTQQLLAIVVFTLAFFLVFFFGILSTNINHFVDIQMFDIIHRSQDNVIHNYKANPNSIDLYGPADKDIVHIIYTDEGKVLYSYGVSSMDSNLLKYIDKQVVNITSKESIDYKYSNKSLYTLTPIEGEGSVIVTLMSQSYQSQFKRLLLNNVINMILIIMGVVFMLLLFWVTYIIHPLNLIRDYIDKIRKNEDADLNVYRDDEIGELAHVLVEMNSELKRQEKLKEEMIQNISHDLKTPIATIKSYGESIKDGVYPYETLEKSVDVIIEHADRLEKKVFNLLMLNRMDYLSNEKSDIDESFELAGVIEQVIVSSNQLRPEIDVVLNAPRSTFNGSVEPWRVVVENLLDNALRYAKSEIVIETDDHYLSVYNDGSYIDENRMNEIFKAYEKGEGGQFGLGLSIVNRVVSNYDYSVNVLNLEDGVKFEIRKVSL